MASSSPSSLSSSSPYPFASAPDIIRSHQKDAYFTGHLANTLTDLYRRLLGARAAHALGPELRTSAALLYFALTTLPGNRTLGEEYCDLVQVDASAPSRPLPALRSRAAYIASSILLPYLLGRSLPSLRERLRRLLERRLATLRERDKADGKSSSEARLWEYAAQHLVPALASSAPLHAVTLALFYFGGAYYQLSKRLLSLRYVFTRQVPDSPDRAGYELLGLLLVVQLAVQAYLHVRAAAASDAAQRDRPAAPSSGPDVDVSLDPDNSYAANSALLMAGASAAPQASRVDIAATTHTPVAARPRFHLGDDATMAYIRGAQQRKCTLCLEELRDPAATQCGHVFCWECIGDWVREKPECPLCRREAMVQHILPLRVM